jgi:hypothetical protein
LFDSQAYDQAIVSLERLPEMIHREEQMAAHLQMLATMPDLPESLKVKHAEWVQSHDELKKRIEDARKKLSDYINEPSQPNALPAVLVKAKRTLAIAPQAGRYFAELNMKPSEAQLKSIAEQGWEVFELKSSTGAFRYFIAPMIASAVRAELRVDGEKQGWDLQEMLDAPGMVVEPSKIRMEDIEARMAELPDRELPDEVTDALRYAAGQEYGPEFFELFKRFDGGIEMRDGVADPKLSEGQLGYYDIENHQIVLNRQALGRFAAAPDVVEPYRVDTEEYKQNMLVVLAHEVVHATVDRSRWDGYSPEIAYVFEEMHADLEGSVPFAQKIGARRFNRYIENVLEGRQFFDAEMLRNPDALFLYHHLFRFETMARNLNSKVFVLGAAARESMQVPGLRLPESFRFSDDVAKISPMLKSVQGITAPDNILIVVHASDPAYQAVVAEVNKFNLAQTTAEGKLKLHVLVKEGDFENPAEQKQTINALDVASRLGQTYLADKSEKVAFEQGISLAVLIQQIPLLKVLAQALAEVAVRTSA